MPIVDVYLIAALFAGLLFGQASEASRRRNAAIVLALMAANYGVRVVARHEAIALAPRVFGPLMPQPCDPANTERPLLARWPREQIQVPALASMPGGASRCLADLTAMPTFLSPFKWRLIARLSNAYELHDIDVLDATLRRPAEAGEAPWRVTIRYPDQWTPTVKAAAAAPLAQTFLGFSRYPAARWVLDQRTGGGYCQMDRHAIRERHDDRSAGGPRKPVRRDRPRGRRRPDSRSAARSVSRLVAEDVGFEPPHVRAMLPAVGGQAGLPARL